MKPKHQGGYTSVHADLCERTLVTLLRGLGPWKEHIYLVGGLVPRYLVPASRSSTAMAAPVSHIGTTDVDIVLDLEMLTRVEAYSRLEENLKALGFERGTNERGRAQHHSWRKSAGQGITVVVDLLCDAPGDGGGQPVPLEGEHRLSALKLPGAHMVIDDYVEIELSAELLDERGIASEKIRVAGIVPFIVLKALAYDQRFEQKDAYDIIYCLSYYGNGPDDVAVQFAKALRQLPDEPLLEKALGILRSRFATDEHGEGYRKDGPVSYANFLTDPGRREQDTLNRRNAATVVERLLARIRELAEDTV